MRIWFTVEDREIEDILIEEMGFNYFIESTRTNKTWRHSSIPWLFAKVVYMQNHPCGQHIVKKGTIYKQVETEREITYIEAMYYLPERRWIGMLDLNVGLLFIEVIRRHLPEQGVIDFLPCDLSNVGIFIDSAEKKIPKDILEEIVKLLNIEAEINEVVSSPYKTKYKKK